MGKTFFDYLQVLSGTVFSRGMAFLNTLIIARLLGPEQFGIFSIFYAAMILTWQIPQAFDAVFVTYAKQLDTQKEKNELLKAPITIKIFYAGLVVVVAYPMALFLARFCFHKSDILVPLIAAMICGLFVNFLTTIASIFQEEERFGRYALMHSFFTVLVFICLITVAIIPRFSSLYAIIIAYIIVSVIVGVVSCAVLIFKVGNPLVVEKRILQLSFRWGKWIIGSQIAFSLFYRLDILCLTRFVDFQDLGIYSVAAQLNYIIGLATGSLAGICLPKAGNAVRSRESLALYFKQSLAAILLIEIGIAFFIMMAPFVVRQLFGSQFSVAGSIIQILSLGWIFYVSFVPFSFLFIALGDTQTKFLIEFFKLGVGFALLVWLVPGYGMLGAAWAMTLTLFTETVASFLILKYRLSRTFKQMCHT